MNRKKNRLAVQHIRVAAQEPNSTFDIGLSLDTHQASIAVLDPKSERVELSIWPVNAPSRKEIHPLTADIISKNDLLPVAVMGKPVSVVKILREHNGAAAEAHRHSSGKPGCRRRPNLSK